MYNPLNRFRVDDPASQTTFRIRMLSPRQLVVVASVSLLLIGVGIGFLIGFYSSKSGSGSTPQRNEGALSASAVSTGLIREINPGNIKKHLHYLTSRPRVAGTDDEREAVEYIASFWKDIGLVGVKIVPYEVMLSYPDPGFPSRVMIINGSNGETVFTSRSVEKDLFAEDTDRSGSMPPFNAYSASGSPEGPLVYVNYGRREDFQLISTKLNITGCICIARYGKGFRGKKATYAAEYGCSGLILYSDPYDYALNGTDRFYPNSWWLPGSGVQSGTLKDAYFGNGDPLTPVYPSVEGSYRIDQKNAELPRIPVYPIGFEDAIRLLAGMTGEVVPTSWAGRLNIAYRFGPGFFSPELRVKLEVRTISKMATIQNVFGFIKGHEEPDRYVLLGNHHDTWAYGAIDPLSATAAMLELSRAMTELVKDGWQLRRTIVFCSWSAEEYEPIGSREWVENFAHILGNRAVAYLNVDLAVLGNYSMKIQALPLLQKVIVDVAKVIPNPDLEEYAQGRHFVYDTWVRRFPDDANKVDESTGAISKQPKMAVLSTGSDYVHFIGFVGIPCADLRYTYEEPLPIEFYPLYHTGYESRHLYETFVDPSYKLAATVAQFWGELARRLSDDAILPFGVHDYSVWISKSVEKILVRFRGMLTTRNVTVAFLENAVTKLKSASERFETRLSKVDVDDPMEVRRINDQMTQFERAFIDASGLPNRPAVRHVVFTPSAYSETSFAGLSDALLLAQKSPGNVPEDGWEFIKKQLSVITFLIEIAASSLEEPTEFL